MFTGIVREMGAVVQLAPGAEDVTFRVACGVLWEELEIGHSISVDGICLTVTRKEDDWFEVDATPETVRRTNLGDRSVGDRVNLEPAMKVSDFLGGHLVQGHVDGTGSLLEVREEGNSWIFRFEAPQEVLRYCVSKGSVTLNGISLTISDLDDQAFEVTIIPHTYEVTNMADLSVGDRVNLEADLVSKYVESHVQRYMAGLGGDGPHVGRNAPS